MIKLIKYFIRIGMMNIACVIDAIAILLILNQWLDLKPNKMKIIVYVLIGLSVLLTCIMLLMYAKYDSAKFFNVITILEKISILIFFIGSVSTAAKISSLGIERGSTLYHIYSYPALLPLISNVIYMLLGNNK